MTLTTSPVGLQVTLDGRPLATPTGVTSVVRMVRTLGVVSPQTCGPNTYHFVSWSDGGAATHTVATPTTNRTYVATYAIPPVQPANVRIVP